VSDIDKYFGLYLNAMTKATKSNKYHYNKTLKAFARENRKSMTKAAVCLWKYVLSGKNMRGLAFKRERPILNYIVDFVCLEAMLIIEVDGFTHDFEESIEEDTVRDLKLSEVGFTVLRFSNWEVLNDIANVAIIIGIGSMTTYLK